MRVHIANWMGGNALTESFVFGDVAGESATRHAQHMRHPRPIPAFIPNGSSDKPQRAQVVAIPEEIPSITWEHTSPIRNAFSLQEGLTKIAQLRTHVPPLEFGMWSPGFFYEAMGALYTAKPILRASLEREESRGVFYRDDFLVRNNDKWLKNIRLTLDTESHDFRGKLRMELTEIYCKGWAILRETSFGFLLNSIETGFTLINERHMPDHYPFDSSVLTFLKAPPSVTS